MANCNYKVNIKDIQSKYSFKIFCSSDNAEIQAEIGNLEDLTTTAKNNLVSAINEVHSDTETNATAISGLQSGKEDKTNKVTSISSTSTDTQYPSAKAVYDSQETQNETISTLETNLEETKEELDYYKTIYNVLPKVEGNGESITLDNTGESILKLDPRGQCKQDGEPTPDYPQQIHEVSGDNTIEVEGKNLFNPQLLVNAYGLTYDSLTGYISGVCNAYNIPTILEFDTPQYLTLSYKGDSSNQSVFFKYTYEDDTTGTIYPWSESDEFTRTPNKKIKKIQTEARDKSHNNNFRLMIELGQSATTFEPYNGDTYELDLGTLKMRGIGTYEDYFVRNSDGQWCKYNAIGKEVLDGSDSESWGENSSKATFAKTLNDMIGANISGSFGLSLINQYKENTALWSDSTIQYGYFVNNKSLNIRDLDYSTLSSFKTNLGTNNLIVYYVLATPYLSLIENETLISQLDKVEKALAKQGKTNISQVNNDAPFKIYASALKEIE